MLAIIPARGGSKGLPGKNIKPLNGRPLISYSIIEALKSELITDVVVSTDDPEIAKVAESEGGWVPFLRPKELATDDSRSIDVYRDTISKLECDFNRRYNAVIILQPTSPLRTSDDINGAINLFIDKKADSVISYTPEHHPVLWHRNINDEGKIEKIFESDAITNRQNLKSTYYPNGSIYIFKSSFIMENENYFSDNTYAYIMAKSKSVDIDDIIDFKFAEFLLKEC